LLDARRELPERGLVRGVPELREPLGPLRPDTCPPPQRTKRSGHLRQRSSSRRRRGIRPGVRGRQLRSTSPPGSGVVARGHDRMRRSELLGCAGPTSTWRPLSVSRGLHPGMQGDARPSFEALDGPVAPARTSLLNTPRDHHPDPVDDRLNERPRSLTWAFRAQMVARVGFEPTNLRVMSPMWGSGVVRPCPGRCRSQDDFEVPRAR
jgi:hypothetical protein